MTAISKCDSATAAPITPVFHMLAAVAVPWTFPRPRIIAPPPMKPKTVVRPEECWPLLFTRAIPESDGRITGLRTVGNTLVVLTDNNIYTVTGNQYNTYGLVRVPAKGHGTSHLPTR